LLVSENNVALAVAILAISKLAAWSVTVNARLSQREMATFLTHSGARRALYFHLTSSDAAGHADAVGADELSFPVIGAISVGPLADTEAEPVYEDPAEQVAAMVYTSGTTGAAKAVMLTHKNLLFVSTNSLRLRRMVPDDIVYGVLPLSHVYGLSALLGATLISGSCLKLVPRFEAEALARALADERITVLHGVPTMYARLLDWSKKTGKPLHAPCLRLAQSGGAPLTAPLKQEFEQVFRLTLSNGYGMTESAPTICHTRLDESRRDCSVGQVIPGVEVRLHGAEGEGNVGELWVRGPNVMKGYYKALEPTAEIITADGWLKTGDLARMDADGSIFIVGRA
ncbi:MAG: long-chain fatty acid--CoA ligase, partial [Gammaproteobacteria bacterium]|nr:long-chain fatty acid--CoA ligase [Gammaproteobacteria bacterium]